MTDASLNEKLKHLDEELLSYGRIAVALSGGVDSALLAVYARRLLGEDAIAITAETPFVISQEKDDAAHLCEKFDIPRILVPVDLLADEDVVANTSKRCYFCKSRIFKEVVDAAKDAGFTTVADGTNATDNADDRPGMKALLELGVVSPLRDAGITKSEVRELAHSFGIDIWDKPSNTCLATRIPQGYAIEADMLERIDAAEAAIHELGFNRVRVRTHGNLARIEVAQSEVPRLAAQENVQDVVAQLKGLGFEHVCIDLDGFPCDSAEE